MHIYTYECTECQEEYEVISEEDTGYSPGHYLFCDWCSGWRLFLPSEHIEIQSIAFED